MLGIILFIGLESPMTVSIITGVASLITALGVAKIWPALRDVFIARSKCQDEVLKLKSQMAEFAIAFRMYVANDDIENNPRKQKSVEIILEILDRIRDENTVTK